MPKSVIDIATKEELLELVNSCNTFSEILSRFGLQNRGRNADTLKRRLIKFGISYDDLINRSKQNRNERLRAKKIPNELIFCEKNSVYSRILRSRLISDKLIPYICQKCGNNGEWMGELISLQVDHINGIPSDNRLENLRFLCPNCHSQTETWGTKGINWNISKKSCINCGKDIYKKSKTGYCKSCAAICSQNVINANFKRRKTERPTVDELKRLIEENGYTATSKKFDISRTTLKKWIK